MNSRFMEESADFCRSADLMLFFTGSVDYGLRSPAAIL